MDLDIQATDQNTSIVLPIVEYSGQFVRFAGLLLVLVLQGTLNRTEEGVKELRIGVCLGHGWG